MNNIHENKGASGGTQGSDSRSSTVAQRSKEQVEHLKNAAGSQVQELQNQASSTRDQTVQRVRRLSSAVRAAGEGIRDDDEWIASYADKASQSIEQVATYLSSADPRTMVRDTEQLARRQPALFFGGAFLLGLAAGRFFKSTRSRSHDYGREPIRGHYSDRDYYGDTYDYPGSSDAETVGATYGAPEMRPRTTPAGLQGGVPGGVSGSSGMPGSTTPNGASGSTTANGVSGSRVVGRSSGTTGNGGEL